MNMQSSGPLQRRKLNPSEKEESFASQILMQSGWEFPDSSNEQLIYHESHDKNPFQKRLMEFLKLSQLKEFLDGKFNFRK